MRRCTLIVGTTFRAHDSYLPPAPPARKVVSRPRVLAMAPAAAFSSSGSKTAVSVFSATRSATR